MSGYRYKDVGIFATDTPWPQVRPAAYPPQPSQSYWPPSFLRNTNFPNKPSEFSPAICPPIARPLAPIPNAPFQNITNRNLNHGYGGLSPCHDSVRSIAHRNGVFLHYDYPIEPMLDTAALPHNHTHNHNNVPQYPPGLGWGTKTIHSPRGFYDEYLPGDSDRGLNSNSLVARSFKYWPPVARFDPFRVRDDDGGGLGVRGYPVDTKVRANVEASPEPLQRGNPPYNYIHPSPPYDNKLKLEPLNPSWQLVYPSFSPELYDYKPPQVLTTVQRSGTPTQTQAQTQDPVYAYAHAPISPPVRPSQLKFESRVSVTSAIKARGFNINGRPSFSRFNPFGDEDSGVNVNACGFQSHSQLQAEADLKVPIVPVHAVQPINVPKDDDPVLAALHRPWAPVHFVGLPSISSKTCTISPPPPFIKLEDPASDLDFQWSRTPSPIENLASTYDYAPLSSPTVCSIKLPGPFMVVKELQSGAFGQAVAVSESGDSTSTRPRLLCLKVFRKTVILKSAWHGGVEIELRVFNRLAEAQPLKEFVFLMTIDAALQDDSYLYFAMGLMQGDLEEVIKRGEHREHAGRWLAQIATAIAALHDIGIIHRDIKPGNVLIDWQTNIRLADFGLSYVHKRRVSMAALGPCAYGYAGTKGYEAPEVLLVTDDGERKPYSNAVDFWSFGCLAFDMLTSDRRITRGFFQYPKTVALHRQYIAEHPDRNFFSICGGLGVQAADLINGLLQVDPVTRFGIDEVKNHPYFNCMDGTNHFRGIEVKARQRVKYEIKLNGDSPRSDLPAQFVPKLHDQRRPMDFPGFNWINLNGAWGRHQNS